MKRLDWLLRALPLLLFLGMGAAALWQGLQPAPPPPPPEIPPEMRAWDRAPQPAPPPAPAPPAGSALSGEITTPGEVGLGEPIEITLSATNTGSIPLTDVILYSYLPEHTHTGDLSKYLRFSKNRLEPGESYRRTALIVSKEPGILELRARFRSAEGVEDRARVDIRRPTAVLLIERSPASEAGRACFEIINIGDAPARDLLLRLPPSNVPIQHWPRLAAGGKRTACFGLSGIETVENAILEVSATAADVATLPLFDDATK